MPNNNDKTKFSVCVTVIKTSIFLMIERCDNITCGQAPSRHPHTSKMARSYFVFSSLALPASRVQHLAQSADKAPRSNCFRSSQLEHNSLAELKPRSKQLAASNSVPDHQQINIYQQILTSKHNVQCTQQTTYTSKNIYRRILDIVIVYIVFISYLVHNIGHNQRLLCEGSFCLFRVCRV